MSKTTKTETRYPHCEKLAGVSEEVRAINEFMEFLQSKGLNICELRGDHYHPLYDRENDLAYEMYGIDSNELEKERSRILDDIRKANT